MRSIDKINKQIGNLYLVYFIDNFALGKDSFVMEISLVGTNLDYNYIDDLVSMIEEFLSMKINYIFLSRVEIIEVYCNNPVLLIMNYYNNKFRLSEQ